MRSRAEEILELREMGSEFRRKEFGDRSETRRSEEERRDD